MPHEVPQFDPQLFPQLLPQLFPQLMPQFDPQVIPSLTPPRMLINTSSSRMIESKNLKSITFDRFFAL